MSAFAALAAVVGEEHVVGPGDARLDAYADPYAFADAPPRAAGVVRPSGVEEVRGVLEVARAHRLALWTVSRGRNFSYGGAEARLPGSVICDLSRMDRVVGVDEACGVAIVEPGVSFEALDAHLRASGSGLAVSVPDLSWGSLVGNTLDRGFSYTSHAEHQATQCGMEVVLADGELVRTGMGALPGADTWGHYRGAWGPTLDGLFVQSNLGIVTKMGVWLRPRPERAAACHIAVPRDDQLGELVEALRPLLLAGTVESNVVVGNAVAATSLMAPRARFHDGDGLLPEAAIQAAMAELHLGRWNAELGLYGPPGLLAARREELERAVSGIAGATLSVTEYAGDADPGDVAPQHRTQLGVPSNDAVAMAAFRGGEPAHSDLGVVCAPTAAAVGAVRRLVEPVVHAAGFDYAAGFMVFRRHVVALCLLNFNRADPEERRRAGVALAAVIAETGAAGYGVYRSHVAHMDLAAAQYAYNDHAALRLAERLKDALDPEGILSPGKQGIWPAGPLREAARARRTAQARATDRPYDLDPMGVTDDAH